ncbi:MAG TPA: protein-glutamate O-methyltransferase CheR [Candidatus Binataceae bacterium]|jgi:two-component system CheB/CheR fusion protein|nr:protein-glutamate O-methyltransferase CheR [Candidatus Binataceae bacterium]
MALKANTIANHQLASVLQRLSEIRCQDFGCYKRSTLGRRVEQRMRIRKCATVARYCDLLAREPAEVDALVSTLLIKLTGFFRDPPLWEKLRQSVLPKIVEQTEAGGEIRVWSVGCATGEEAYSIGMLLAELSRPHAFSFKVFGTDRDHGAIAAAGRGGFTREQVRGLSPDLLERWFQRTAEGYIVRRELRRCVVFGVQDLVTDTPISRVDLILCRNIFIYLDSAGQRRSLMHLYRGLSPGRVIVLGKSELLPFAQELFEAVDLPLRIYRKRAAAPVDVAHSFADGATPNEPPSGRPFPGAGDENSTAAVNAIDTAVVMVSKDGVITLWNDGAARL